MSEMRDLILTVRIPFCLHPCDLYEEWTSKQTKEIRDSYFHALQCELDSISDELGDYRLRALRITGGIPTILADMQLPDLVRAIESRVMLADDFELSIFTGPGCIGINVLSRLKDYKLSRMDFLLASSHPYELEAIDYRQTPGDLYVSRQILEYGKQDNFGIDISLGLPGQTETSVLGTLKTAYSYAPTALGIERFHVKNGSSLYRRLVIEKGTSISHVNHRALPDDDMIFRCFCAAEDSLSEAGFSPFLATRYSKPGFEGRYETLVDTDTERMTMGVGGESICGGYRLINTGDLDAYIKGAGEPAATVVDIKPLDDSTRMSLYARGTLLLGKRLDFSTCTERYGMLPDRALLETAAENNLIELSEGGAILTRRGRCFHDEAIAGL